MTIVALRVEAPIVSFRNPHAREFAETYRVPPPSTLYGMLLSLVGEERRARHAGVRLAVAVLGEPAVSTVLRTVWRVKNLSLEPGVGENRRMDFQQLLTDLRAAIWIDSSEEPADTEPLTDRVARALREPDTITRYGGLSLGESRDLVDVVEPLRPRPGEDALWLLPDPVGDLTLPVWPDHVAGASTRWARFRPTRRPLVASPAPTDFVRIAPA